MLFIDKSDNRYIFTADIDWHDIRNIPNLATQEELNTIITYNNNTYLKKTGDTMSGALNINNTQINF